MEIKKLPKKYFIEDGILLAHKPVGISSFDLIRKMRKLTGIRKIGHTGTLDPLASGLMILGIGSGTKKIKHYVGLDKEYLAEILIGKSTETGDREGKIILEKKVQREDLSKEKLEKAFQTLLGEHYYPAPLYSAVKVGGKALYKYAREGKEPPYIPEKKMHLKKFEILDIKEHGDFALLKIQVKVGSGTYIRTLGEELGKILAYPASLYALKRISIDKYLDVNSFHLSQKKRQKNVIMRMYLKIIQSLKHK